MRSHALCWRVALDGVSTMPAILEAGGLHELADPLRTPDGLVVASFGRRCPRTIPTSFLQDVDTVRPPAVGQAPKKESAEWLKNLFVLGKGGKEVIADVRDNELITHDSMRSMVKPVADAANQWAQYGYHQSAYASAAKAAAAKAADIGRIAAVNAAVEKSEGQEFLQQVDSASGNIVARELGYSALPVRAPWEPVNTDKSGYIVEESVGLLGALLTMEVQDPRWPWARKMRTDERGRDSERSRPECASPASQASEVCAADFLFLEARNAARNGSVRVGDMGNGVHHPIYEGGNTCSYQIRSALSFAT